MPDNRVRVDVERTDILKRLTGEAPFEHDKVFAIYADAIAFAAALGAAKDLFLPLEKPASEPSPIRQDIFSHRGHEMLFLLLALGKENNPRVLSNDSDSEERRVSIFEAFANGGLAYLEKELKGEPDAVEKLLLIMRAFDQETGDQDQGLPDLRRLLR